MRKIGVRLYHSHHSNTATVARDIASNRLDAQEMRDMAESLAGDMGVHEPLDVDDIESAIEQAMNNATDFDGTEIGQQSFGDNWHVSYRAGRRDAITVDNDNYRSEPNTRNRAAGL